MCAHIYVITLRDQKVASDSLELDLQAIMNQESAGSWPGYLLHEYQVLPTAEPPLQLIYMKAEPSKCSQYFHNAN